MSIDELELASPSAKILKPSVQGLIGRLKPKGYPNGPILENGQSPLSQRINSLTREARKESIGQLREFVSYYKEGAAALQDFIIGEIIEDPDISLNELNSILDQFRDELGISENQYRLFRYILSEYYGRHQEIEEIRKSFSTEDGEVDNNRLFRSAFGFQNKGVVTVGFGPTTINFSCSDFRDYTSAFNDIDISKLTKQEIESLLEETSNSGAAFLEGRSPNLNLTLTGSMIITNMNMRIKGESEAVDAGDRLELFNSSIERVIMHETGHAIFYFLQRAAKDYINYKIPSGERVPAELLVFREVQPLKGSIKKLRGTVAVADASPLTNRLNAPVIEEELRLVMLDERREYEDDVKNEILSYTIDGSSKEEILESIKGIMPDYGNKDWVNETIDQYTEIVGESRQELVEEQANRVFSGSFNSLVSSAIDSIFTLQKEWDYSKAIAFLRTVPLRRWPREVERIIQAKATRESEPRNEHNID